MDSKKLLEEIKARSVVSERKIDAIYYKETEYKKGNECAVFDETWQPFPLGGKWGEFRDTHFWFYFRVSVPEAIPGREFRLRVSTGKSGWDGENPQFLAYVNGKCMQGLDINHTFLYVESGKEAEIYLYAYSGTPSASGKNDKFASELSVSLIEIDREYEELYFDVEVPVGITEYSADDSSEYVFLSGLIEKVSEYVQLYGDDGKKLARDFLQNELYGKKWRSFDTEIACIGHTHIDIAWMWTVLQAREKVQRSFATELSLIERNDDFRFTSSQAYLYNAVKEEAPDLYERIKKEIALKNWEAEGAAWVEFDSNVPCGESLIRQVFYGKKFFREEFGAESKVMWLPDVFGYSAALPQILVRSGVEKFVTAKISWNDTNRLPNDTFMWKGIDGTEILTHFICTTPKRKGLPVIDGTGYVSKATPAEIAGTYERFRPKSIAKELICCYGFGDGGGGVTEDMIKRIRRMKNGLPGCPPAKMTTVTETFRAMEEKLKGAELPVWKGELYLEFHRGTYTTRADNKKYNRQCERLLKQAEILCTADHIINGTAYPQNKLESLWKQVLLNQFHDILPGSSIREVYDVTDAEYKTISAELSALINDAKKRVAPKVKIDEHIVFNMTGFIRSGAVNGIMAENVPPYGYKTVKKTDPVNSVTAKGDILENSFYRIRFGKNGQIEEFIYKPLDRSVLNGANGNVLTAYKDIPAEYDAWNIDKDYINYGSEIIDLKDRKIITSGGKTGFEFRWKFGNSEIKQSVVMDDGVRVDFITEVDWHEKHVLLKALFPIAVNTDKARYEIQFGNLERTTHNNTSWDSAQFEVPAQRYAFLKENGFGFALLNDCKYGYCAKGNVLGLSLLRSPDYPCRGADEGKHEFVYSVMCGAENFENEVFREAEFLNSPLTDFESGTAKAAKEFSLIRSDKENVAVSAFKMADNGNGIIIRVYETIGKTTDLVLTTCFEIGEAYITNLEEKIEARIGIEHNKIKTRIRPYEIITFLLRLKNEV